MHDESHDAVIVSAVRTPVGKFQATLSSLSAVELGAIVVRDAVARTGIDPALFQTEMAQIGQHAEAWLAAYRMTPEGRGYVGAPPVPRGVIPGVPLREAQFEMAEL